MTLSSALATFTFLFCCPAVATAFNSENIFATTASSGDEDACEAGTAFLQLRLAVKDGASVDEDKEIAPARREKGEGKEKAKAEKEKLREEKRRAKEEKERLREERAKAEKERLREDKAKAEKERLREERLREERERAKEEKEKAKEEPSTAADGTFQRRAAYATLGATLLLLTREACRMAKGKASALPSLTARRRIVQAIAIVSILVDLMEGSFVTPFAYDFALALKGPNYPKHSVASFSGFIQGSSAAGMAMGTVVAYSVSRRRNHVLNRALMILAPLTTSGLYSALGYALRAHGSSGFLAFSVLATRIAAGFASGFDLLLASLAQDVTEDSEQVAYSLLGHMAISGGLALGPVLSSLASKSIGAGPGGRGLFSLELRACSMVSALYAALALSIACCLPAAADWRATLFTDVSSDSDANGSKDTSEPSHVQEGRTQQACVLAIGIACTFLGIFACSAVEVSSSLLFELQYGWGVARIGFMMGMLYAVVVVLCGLILGMESCLDTRYIAAAAAVGTLVGAALVFDAGWGNATQLLLSDVLQYPCLTALVAIVEGYMFMGAHEAISTEGLYVAVYAIDSVARALAAPMVRSIIGWKGRDTYACVQLGATLLLTCLTAYLSQVHRGEHRSQESVGEVDGTSGPLLCQLQSD
eukprot:CAMPEP_0179035262 /NCGR_PEP_ID=MMETSP0796-20121207/13022_1 /TAXON_ID=73915 /ORGANISM="Pyrodinium bahamense, Strain pbaha01" /LENGTH=649 /DNA_ID=CAMNT_0020731533 /DNA_START=72 /DNA_END=2021 /DNA_ORIENTATION=-